MTKVTAMLMTVTVMVMVVLMMKTKVMMMMMMMMVVTRMMDTMVFGPALPCDDDPKETPHDGRQCSSFRKLVSQLIMVPAGIDASGCRSYSYGLHAAAVSRAIRPDSVVLVCPTRAAVGMDSAKVDAPFKTLCPLTWRSSG